ncbi:MAG: 3'(2'),5'-bisphosphate nucleotidase CysQ [Ignavibacteria bacterium]|jgi:3'(2'), 5'-bisphosphate nucleotidase
MAKQENINIDRVIDIALSAGKEILKIYNSDDFEVEMKSDNSPLTKADKHAHEIIKRSLLSIYPTIPLLSEEGKDIQYEERKNWERFWLVDPLDGTKEFIKKNGEFTVNIALIENNEPTLGIIYAPAFKQEVGDSNLEFPGNPDCGTYSNTKQFPGTLYYATINSGAYKQYRGRNPINLTEKKVNKEKIVAVKSRSHSSPDEEKALKNYNVTDSVSVGSSLKFCMVAEGVAQVYYRHGPTNEWDVGAGYAIAKYAGAVVTGLKFNKENLLNNSFLVERIN